MKALGILFVCMLLSLGVQAQEADSAREADVARRAKARLYPGGVDEEDLRVQNPLLIPTRKLAPKDDKSEEGDDESSE